MAYDLVQSVPNVWRPSAAEPSKAIEPVSCEVTALSLKAGGGAVHVSLYDAKSVQDANPAALVWALDAAQQDTDTQSFPSALIFKKGLFAVCDNGLDFNAELCFAVKKIN